MHAENLDTPGWFSFSGRLNDSRGPRKKIDSFHACSKRCSVNGFQRWGRVPKSEVCRPKAGQNHDRKKKKEKKEEEERRRNDRGERNSWEALNRAACAYPRHSPTVQSQIRRIKGSCPVSSSLSSDPYIIFHEPDRQRAGISVKLYPRWPHRKDKYTFARTRRGENANTRACHGVYQGEHSALKRNVTRARDRRYNESDYSSPRKNESIRLLMDRCYFEIPIENFESDRYFLIHSFRNFSISNL